MTIVGYTPASCRDATGRRMAGYRLFGLCLADGVAGQMSTNVFVPAEVLSDRGLAPKDLLGRDARILLDPCKKICTFTVAI